MPIKSIPSQIRKDSHAISHVKEGALSLISPTPITNLPKTIVPYIATISTPAQATSGKPATWPQRIYYALEAPVVSYAALLEDLESDLEPQHLDFVECPYLLSSS